MNGQTDLHEELNEIAANLQHDWEAKRFEKLLPLDAVAIQDAATILKNIQRAKDGTYMYPNAFAVFSEDNGVDGVRYVAGRITGIGEGCSGNGDWVFMPLDPDEECDEMGWECEQTFESEELARHAAAKRAGGEG